MPKGVLESSNQMSAESQQAFIIEQMTKGMMTAMPVIVMGVNSPDNELIDVTPALSQENANGDSVEHNVIYNVPVCRLQRGNSAVIMPPVKGDKGLVVFATQDISIFKKVKNFCKTGTFARHDWSNAIYVMGLCNAAPTQYIRFNDADITITTPKLIVNGNIETTGTIKNNGHVVDNTHTHTGVQTGSGTTGQVT
jgi:hypothetical protein